MKILRWMATRDFRIPPSAVRDVIPLTGLFLFNCVQFSQYNLLVHVSTKPWLLLVWLYALVGFVPLIWRDRAPMIVFAVQWVMAVTAWPILPYYTPVVGIMVALYTVSIHCRWKISLLALLVSLIPFSLDAAIVYLTYFHSVARLNISIYIGVYFSLVAGGVWGWGRVTRASNRRGQKVTDERDEAKIAVTEQR